MKYEPTIGLEIHAELKTKTKMFCSSRNDPHGSEPNTNICPVCMGHPGTLPVVNKETVRHVLRVGLALGGTLADFTEFDRKNYFYPDLPKGYQISQYEHPLVKGGALAGVVVTRVHLEEDTARSAHDEKGDASIIDFNRAGVPLLELVTEPVVKTAEQAVIFAKELQLLLRYVGASDANMERGEMRVEANISIAPAGTPLGTKVEVKNLNSFRAVERSIAYEIKRQAALLEQGGSVTQETRGWDEARQETFSQRVKESSHDYRYFPEPDLPKIIVSEIEGYDREMLFKALPELPQTKRERYGNELYVRAGDIETLIADRALCAFFEAVIVGREDDRRFIERSVGYIISDLGGLRQGAGRDIFETLSPEKFSDLIALDLSGEISSRGVKDVLRVMVEEGGDPRDIAKARGLFQNSNTTDLAAIVQDIIKAHPGPALDLRSGKTAALQFLIGQGMKATGGAANPQVLRSLFEEMV